MSASDPVAAPAMGVAGAGPGGASGVSTVGRAVSRGVAADSRAGAGESAVSSTTSSSGSSVSFAVPDFPVPTKSPRITAWSARLAANPRVQLPVLFCDNDMGDIIS